VWPTQRNQHLSYSENNIIAAHCCVVELEKEGYVGEIGVDEHCMSSVYTWLNERV
jgi:hypothetical protein